MSDLNSMFTNLFATEAAPSLEKTAEDHLLAALQGDNQVGENPFAQMSNEELMKLASDLEAEGQQQEALPDELEKTAAEMLGGQVMAHSMVHEMGLIKEALANGLCRVCKESPLDAEGSSICTGCLSASDE
jgi:hypothetical protein